MSEAFCPLEKSINDIADALTHSVTSSVELVNYYHQRISSFDCSGPQINSVSALASDALEVASRLDQERATIGPRGKLHGVPLLVKDNIDTLGFATTGGSIALVDSMPARDADVIAALKRCGAIVLGKTNMSEFANSGGRFGYSSSAGLTLNPYHLGRNASGSSSGSAAAVAANFAAAALGTDTFGSVRGPASATGLAGLRPTHRLLSDRGVLPFALSFDTVGPICRRVEDLPVLMNAMGVSSGNDGSDDPAGRPARAIYRETLDASALQGARIAVLEGLPEADPEIRAMLESTLVTLRAAGAALESVALPADLLDSLLGVISPVAAAQFSLQIPHYLLQAQQGSPRSLQEIVAILDAHQARPNGREVNPVTLEGLRRAAIHQVLSASEKAALGLLVERLHGFRNLMLGWFATGLSAVVFPTLLSPATPRFDQPDPTFHTGVDNPMVPLYLSAAAGLPELTVPAGRSHDGLPLGISLQGAPFSEQSLMDLGYAFQMTHPARFAPSMTVPNGPPVEPSGKYGSHQSTNRA
jgi:amidase